MKRPSKHGVEIDVVPYLDSMVIVLNLICLIIIIMIIPIALNPTQINVLSFENLFQPRELRKAKVPTYLDCRPDGVNIIPGDAHVGLADITRPDNPVTRLMAAVQRNAETNYLILMVRPNSLPVYRHLRKEIIKRELDVGVDVLDSNDKVDWEAAARQLRVTPSLPE